MGYLQIQLYKRFSFYRSPSPAPGTIVSFQNKTATDIPYAEFGEEQLATSTKDVSQDIHDIVSTTLKILLSDHPQTWLSLSGGFDSRYLLALSTIHSKTPPLCATVDCSEDRVSTASLIADTLNVPLRVFTAPKSTWDLFKEVFHYTADGFPISKHVLYRLAMESSGVPIVNGYLGDFLIRGARDTCLGRYEQDCNNNLSEVLQKHHKGANFRIFRSSIAKRILDRSRVPMDLAVEKWSKSGQSFIRADLYYRQRFYISNNFLQHLPLTEALLPFYSWELIDYKLCRDFSLFNNELYAHIFWNFFPRIANIPKSKNEAHSSISEHTKKWSREFIPLISGRHRPSVVSGFRKLPWVIAGIVGASKVESTILLLKRLSMLEDRILSSGIDFDWYRI